jgi:hypothetical protein
MEFKWTTTTTTRITITTCCGSAQPHSRRLNGDPGAQCQNWYSLMVHNFAGYVDGSGDGTLCPHRLSNGGVHRQNKGYSTVTGTDRQPAHHQDTETEPTLTGSTLHSATGPTTYSGRRCCSGFSPHEAEPRSDYLVASRLIETQWQTMPRRLSHKAWTLSFRGAKLTRIDPTKLHEETKTDQTRLCHWQHTPVLMITLWR